MLDKLYEIIEESGFRKEDYHTKSSESSVIFLSRQNKMKISWKYRIEIRKDSYSVFKIRSKIDFGKIILKTRDKEEFLKDTEEILKKK